MTQLPQIPTFLHMTKKVRELVAHANKIGPPTGGGNLYRKALEEGTDYTLTVNIPNPGNVTDIEVFIEFQEEVGDLDEIQLQLVAIIPEGIAGGPNTGPLIEVLAKKRMPSLEKYSVYVYSNGNIHYDETFSSTRFIPAEQSCSGNSLRILFKFGNFGTPYDDMFLLSAVKTGVAG